MRRTVLPRLLAGVGAMLFALVGLGAERKPLVASEPALLQALDRGVMERGLWKVAVRSPSVEVRRLAAEVLASAAEPESVRRLRQLADDPDP
jgi:hypothetical protein